MVELPRVQRGQPFLGHCLGEHPFDLRTIGLADFRRWLCDRLSRWQQDPVFVQRSGIRDLRRRHPELSELERRHRKAEIAFSSSPHFPMYQRLKRELHGTSRAIASIGEALDGTEPQKRGLLGEKLRHFQARKQTLLEELAQLAATSSEYLTWTKSEQALRQLCVETGLDQAEAILRTLLRQQGRHSGRTGKFFEGLACAVTRQFLLPDLLRCEPAAGPEDLRILTGVTLGAARTEIDQLVVRLPKAAGDPVGVLAMIEAKRNVNDLAHGFRQRQENLAWLTGDRAGYDPQAYRTEAFLRGHFDTPAVHRQGKEEFVLDGNSFCGFHRDPGTGFFLHGLYLITRPGPLWGISSKEMARFRDWVARDLRFDLEDEEYLRQLLARLRSLGGPLETRDLLEHYARHSTLSGNVLFVCG